MVDPPHLDYPPKYQDIIVHSTNYLKQMGLSCFVMALPFTGPMAERNKTGIRDKILRNQSYIATEFNTLGSSVLVREDHQAVESIHHYTDRLTDGDNTGFAFIAAEVMPNNEERPVSGAIVELVDDDDDGERSIRGIWCRRNLPPHLAENIMRVFVLGLFAHAFQLTPSTMTTTTTTTSRTSNTFSNKLVSTLESTCVSFPRDVYDFLTVGLAMSRHWETADDDGGTHNDHPSFKCSCKKLAQLPSARPFWGIGERRFLKNICRANNTTKYIPPSPPEEYIGFFHKTCCGDPVQHMTQTMQNIAYGDHHKTLRRRMEEIKRTSTTLKKGNASKWKKLKDIKNMGKSRREGHHPNSNGKKRRRQQQLSTHRP